MTSYHRMTPEEDAYGRLLDENWEELSEAARTIVREATGMSCGVNLTGNILYDPQDYDEAMEKLSAVAAQLTGRDRELLMEFTRRVLVASASVDLFDGKTLVGRGVYIRSVHYFYRMVGDMIERTLHKEFEREWLAKQEPRDISDAPF